MKSAEVSSAPVAGSTTQAFGIGPQDDDLTCVWKVMSDGKGRTATELMAVLADFPDQVDPDDVGPLLRILVTNGFASQQQNRSEEPIYLLKKGVTMSMIGAQENTKATKLRGPQSDLQGTRTEGKINLTEGIKVCLWKVVADRKTRTTDQICDILGAYGINREVAKDAVIRAKVNEKWFDTLGKGESMTLKLKKHIKMPPIENVDPTTLRQKMTPGAIRPMHPQPVSAPAVLTMPGGQRSRHHHFQENGQPRKNDQPTATFHQDLAPVVQMPARPTPLVTKGDSLDVAIWKVMSDYKPYTATEVAVLLEEFGHNPGTVRARITKLHLTAGYHWFTREKKGSGRVEYVYTLNENIPMPVVQSATPETPAAPGPAAAQQLSPQLPLIDNNKEDESMKLTGNSILGDKLAAAQQNAGQKPAAPAAPAVQPAAANKDGASNDASSDNDSGFNLASLPDTDLLRFQVVVRNTPYSFPQAEKLARELVAQGFGEGHRRDTPQSILQTAYRIGNASFTGNELEDLTEQLVNVGFGDNE